MIAPYDIEILKEIAGLPNTIKHWGAAMGMSVEVMARTGLIQKTLIGGSLKYQLTTAGKEALENPA